MAFPSSPTNGQQATVGNVIYQYTTATNSWTKILGSVGDFSAVGNITAGNVISLGVVTAVGNLSGVGYTGLGDLNEAFYLQQSNEIPQKGILYRNIFITHF